MDNVIVIVLRWVSWALKNRLNLLDGMLSEILLRIRFATICWSKNRGETHLQQDTTEVQDRPPECTVQIMTSAGADDKNTQELNS
jgi:hypothetical protein